MKKKQKKLSISELLDLIKKEGDRKEFVHKGLECLIFRDPLAYFLCGYVKIPEGCSLEPQDDTKCDLKVHGGITYDGDGKHFGKTGRWVGFDCAHAGDLIPSVLMFNIKSIVSNFIYKDMEYVEKEVKKLAEQIKKLM